MPLSPSEILETIKMVATENLDVRTVTMGISLQDCVHPDPEALQERIYNKIVRYAGRLVPVCQEIEAIWDPDHQQTGGHHARGPDLPDRTG